MKMNNMVNEVRDVGLSIKRMQKIIAHYMNPELQEGPMILKIYKLCVLNHSYTTQSFLKLDIVNINFVTMDYLIE